MKHTSSSIFTFNWPLWFVIIIALTAAVFALIDHPSFGYAKTSIMMDRYEGAVQAGEQLKKDLTVWEENIKKLAGDIQTLQQEFQEKNNFWFPSTRKGKQAAFMKKQEELNRYRSLSC